jgi:hypothetical protein
MLRAGVPFVSSPSLGHSEPDSRFAVRRDEIDRATSFCRGMWEATGRTLGDLRAIARILVLVAHDHRKVARDYLSVAGDFVQVAGDRR